MAQAALQGGIAVQRTKVAEQLAGAGEQHGVAIDHCLMGDVLSEHRLADAVWPDKDDIGGLFEEVERDQRVNRGAVAVLGPGPVEVTEWLEAADMRGAESTLQAAAGALLLLPVEHWRQPGLGCDLGPVRQQTVQVQRLGAGAQGVVFSLWQVGCRQRHRYAPSADRRFRVHAVAPWCRVLADAPAARRRSSVARRAARAAAPEPDARCSDAVRHAGAPREWRPASQR